LKPEIYLDIIMVRKCLASLTMEALNISIFYLGGMNQMKGKLTRWVSVLMIAALLIPSGWLVPSVAKAESQDIPVILYHRIVQTPSNEWTDTSIDKTNSMMQYLDDHDYTTMTSQQYVEILSGEATTIPEKPILLTFVDATPDFVTNALPVLEEL